MHLRRPAEVNRRLPNRDGGIVNVDLVPDQYFMRQLDYLKTGERVRSPLSQLVGSKRYHDTVFAKGPYPVD